MDHQHTNLYIALSTVIIILFASLLTNKWTVLNGSKQQSGMGINAGESGNMNVGIWQTCGNISANINTPNIPNINNNMRRGINIDAHSCSSNSDSNFTPVKILSILGIVLLIGAIVLLNMMPEHHMYSIITVILGGLFSLVAAIV